jgi:hypothetical protein
VREFYYARDAMNELVSTTIARKKKLICGMKTFQTCKIIVSNMLMFRQEFNYSEFAISHPTVTSFF